MVKTPDLHAVKTVGELRALIADLPDDMPVHHHGNMGDHPPGLLFVTRNLAVAKSDPDYFADIEHDPLWSQPQERRHFGPLVKSLCTL